MKPNNLMTSNSRRLLIGLFFASACILSGCSSISYPVWLGDNGVEQMCESDGLYAYSHLGVTKQFEVHLVDAQGISEHCGQGMHQGNQIEACILGNKKIFVKPGNKCASHMAHELSHGFGLHFVDRPTVHRG